MPDSKSCATSESLALSDFIKVKGIDIVHSHGPEGEHSHPFMIAYSWLDPAVAKKQASKITERLSKVYPQHADQFTANLKKLGSELDTLKQDLASLSEKSIRVYSANPNTKFLTRAAGISEVSAAWNVAPDGTNEGQLVMTDQTTGDAGFVLLVQSPSPELAESLKAQSKTAIKIDLLDKAPTTGDYFSVMQENIRQLSSAK